MKVVITKNDSDPCVYTAILSSNVLSQDKHINGHNYLLNATYFSELFRAVCQQRYEDSIRSKDRVIEGANDHSASCRIQELTVSWNEMLSFSMTYTSPVV